jgi:Ca2+-binding RTX toxin-like protein
MSTLNAAQLAAFSVDAYDAATDVSRQLAPGFVRLTGLAGEAGFGGLHAAAYFNQATGELVIAYRGSEDLRDLFTNLSAVTGTGDTHLNRALAFAAEARAYAAKLSGTELADANVTLTGHGVGGGFASMVSVATGLSATTFNGLRIGGLMSAMEERFGSLAPDYASRITNYVDSQDQLYTLPRRTTEIGRVVDVQASALSFSGQLQARLVGATGNDVLDSVYDWLSHDDAERQRAQRLLMALELQFGGVDPVDGAGQPIAPGAAYDQQRLAELNKLMQTDRADIIGSRVFDRLLVDGSDSGELQDASGYGDSDDLLIGATGADQLIGGAGDDVLFGGDGNDVLMGDAGDDFMLGGAGADVYRFGASAGQDTIHDKQGANRIVVDGKPIASFFVGDGVGAWTSVDGALHIQKTDQFVLSSGAGLSLTLSEFEERDFGVRLFDQPVQPVAAQSVEGDKDGVPTDDLLLGSRQNDAIYGRAGYDRIYAGGGDDIAAGGIGRDYIVGDGVADAGADILLGGAEGDVLIGGAGADRLYADEETSAAAAIAAGALPGTNDRGDWLAAGEGADALVGSAASDVLAGGGGADLLIGGGGRDYLLGDADYAPSEEEFDWSFVGYADGSSSWYTFADPSKNDPASSDGDLIYAGDGDDWVVAGWGDDVVFAGAGRDFVAGNLGADTISGEDGSDTLYGGEARIGDLSDRGEDYLDGGDGNDSINGSAGDNILLGGAGNDVIRSGPGADFIDGGDGDDAILAQGADVVLGGAGNDRILTSGLDAVSLDGGAGNDTLSGDDGTDTIVGGEGDDTLRGREGADLLDGGTGNDRYQFAVGDGVDQVVDAGGSDVIELISNEGVGALPETAIARDSIRLVADNSEVYLAYGGQGDRIRLGADPRGLIESIELRHVAGSVQTVEAIDVGSLRVEYAGTADAEILFGVDGFRNALTGGGGNDILLGSYLEDELAGGAGSDLLRGGEGSDRYVVAPGGGMDTIEDDGASGIDVLSVGVTSDSATLGLAGGALLLDLGNGDGVQIHGFDPLDALASTTIERIVFTDGDVSYQQLLGRGFDLIGSVGADILSGTSLVDRFDGRGGDDRMIGGKGNDQYKFGRGYGHDVIVDQDTTQGNIDRVVLTGGVTARDVDVTASADRLTLRIRGTDDRLDIQWAPDQGLRIEEIEFADGERWGLDVLSSKFQPANVPPGLRHAITDQLAREDEPFGFQVPADTFEDPTPADGLTLSASLADGSALPAWLQFDAATGRFGGMPGNADVGIASVTVTATDPGGASVSDTFDIVVENVNDAPTLVQPIGSRTATEDALFEFTVPAGTFRDVDAGDVIQYFATLDKGAALPAWLKFDAGTGRFSGTPANDDVGSYRIHLFAVDKAQAMAEEVFDLAVENTNDAPTLGAPLADWTVREAHPLEFQIPAGTFVDVDKDDSLAYDATLANGAALPAWLEFDRATGTFKGTPGRDDIGSYAIRVEARDEGGATVTDDFVIKVDAVKGQVLTGTAGDDTLIGDAGDDTLAGRSGADVLRGGAGDDSLVYSRDAVWSGNLRRTNVGSPGFAGTGETASLNGRSRSFDVFDGGTGLDTLVGTSQGDAVLLDDASRAAQAAAPRLAGIEVISVGDGSDLVDLTSTRFSYGAVLIDGGAGSDIIWSSGGDDLLYGGAGNDRIFAGGGDDYLSGDGGSDDLDGAAGNDVVQGDSGNDKIFDAVGNGLLDGRGGSDDIYDGTGNALLVGGRGADRVTLGGGHDIVAFNRGDGRDTVRGVGAAVLSLGGGIEYRDLALRKSGADLLLEVGGGERITFQDWYASPQNQVVATMQVVAETMQASYPATFGALFADKVQWFDFSAIVAAFDDARAANSNLGRWQMMDKLIGAHLGGSSDAALGGDLAYQYGLNGAFTGLGLGAVQDVLRGSGFGSERQTLRPLAELTKDDTKLA